MRHFFVSCFSIMMLPVFVHAQPVENGKCCFTHEPFKTGSNPTNGCLEVTTCSEIQQRDAVMQTLGEFSTVDARARARKEGRFLHLLVAE